MQCNVPCIYWFCAGIVALKFFFCCTEKVALQQLFLLHNNFCCRNAFFLFSVSFGDTWIGHHPKIPPICGANGRVIAIFAVSAGVATPSGAMQTCVASATQPAPWRHHSPQRRWSAAISGDQFARAAIGCGNISLAPVQGLMTQDRGRSCFPARW